jgi:hypothetical protein
MSMTQSDAYFGHSYKDHFKVYKEQCEMLGIPVYQHATLKSQQNTGLLVHTCLYCYLFLIMLCSMCQGTLDSIITNQPHSLPFTQAGLLDYIIELVVSVDNVHIFPHLRQMLPKFL